MPNTMNINQFTFEVIEAEDLRLALLPEMAQKYRTGTCGKSFIEIMSGYAREVTALPLNFKKKPVFGFVVLPHKEKFFKSYQTALFLKECAGFSYLLMKFIRKP